MITRILFPVLWACFVLRLVSFWIHSALVFVSKPGSRLLVFVPISVSMFLARDLLHPPFEPYIEWLSSKVGYDLLSIPYFLDVLLHAGLFPFWLAYGLIAAFLRPLIGALPTPSFPLPPRMAPSPRIGKLKRLEASIATCRAGKPQRDAMEKAYNALPRRISAVIACPGDLGASR